MNIGAVFVYTEGFNWELFHKYRNAMSGIEIIDLYFILILVILAGD